MLTIINASLSSLAELVVAYVILFVVRLIGDVELGPVLEDTDILE